MEHGADVNAPNTSHVTPLHLASSFLGLDLVRLFLDHGANANAKDDWGQTPLHRVLGQEDYPNDDHETPLHLVAGASGKTSRASEAKRAVMYLAIIDS
ncbi:hypothetical protein V8E53_005932 [Lactarius tabidus]